MKECSKCKVEKSLDEFHIQKNGKFGRDSKCKKCKAEYQSSNYIPKIRTRKQFKFKINNKIFIERSEKNHGKKYGYDLVEYIGSTNKVKIICPIHGIFEQKPFDHMKGIGCSKCAWNKPAHNRLQQDDYIDRCKKIHFDLYDYSLVDYKGDSEKIDIICKKHGIFHQQASSHLRQKQGCPKCNISYGEKTIYQFLESNNIKFEYEKSFSDLKVKSRLRFDFYIADKNMIIEYDGIQHFKPTRINGVSYEKAIELFKKTQKHDKLKTQYCIDKNINLIRISYKCNILEILKDKLC